MKPTRSLTHLEEERAVPWGDPGLFAAHLARYELAARHVHDRRVLDVGCGEGYGSALLAEHAREVVGIDYSPAAIRHCCASYVRDNLRFEVADATALPRALGRFDVVTCFEVVEHLEDHAAFFAGVADALAPDGLLLLSTPNRLVDALYEVTAGRERYEYHVNVLTPRELRRRAREEFREVALYGQSLRGNTLHLLLKGADVFNLRHRVFRSARTQASIATTVMGQRGPERSASFRFSRLLVRQSPMLLLVARRPRRS